MAQSTKRRQIAARTTTEVEYLKGRRTADVPQQCLDVLLHIVIARAAPEFSGAFIVVIERCRRDLVQLLAGLCHGLAQCRLECLEIRACGVDLVVANALYHCHRGNPGRETGE